MSPVLATGGHAKAGTFCLCKRLEDSNKDAVIRSKHPCLRKSPSFSVSQNPQTLRQQVERDGFGAFICADFLLDRNKEPETENLQP